MPHRGIFNLKEIGFLRSCRNRTDALTRAHSLAALVPGCPGKGKKMLLHSVMRKKPDNFLSRHCHYSMFRRRGCKEKPPFLQIFFSFCCGQQNGILFSFPSQIFHSVVYPLPNLNSFFTSACCAAVSPSSFIRTAIMYCFSKFFLLLSLYSSPYFIRIFR